MKKKKLRSQEWFGGNDKMGFVHRSWLRNQGYPDDHFRGKPVIGICNTWSELTPCNGHLREFAEIVKKGVLEAGGFPLEFPVMSLGETIMRPTTMLFRNLASMDVEESIRANPLDGESEKKVFIPSDDINSLWASSLDFDDFGWTPVSGPPGEIGYENSSGYQDFISLNVISEMSTSTSCYVRFKFDIDNETLQKLTTLTLKVLYDDGFAAFLNGAMVADSNVSFPLSWNSTASSGLETDDFSNFNITEYLNQLVEGENLLAIQALNSSLTSSDFIINAELVGSNTLANSILSPELVLYDGPIQLTKSTHVKARALSGTEWSPLTEKIFINPADFFGLTISEVHYHPWVKDSTMDDRLYEFIELKNVAESTIDLSKISFTDGIEFTFPEEAVLSPGNYIVLSSDSMAFFDRYKFNPFGVYNGFLNNDGERIVLESPLGYKIIDFVYNDANPWPEEADGQGPSLEIIDSDSSLNSSSNWKASLYIHGSPGADGQVVNSLKDSENSPDKFILSQNYPNPFNPSTRFSYSIYKNSFVTLKIYNVLGEEIETLVSKWQKSGKYSVLFNAKNISTGVYFYKLQAGGLKAVKKFIYIK